MAALMVLNRNGQAISLSRGLADAYRASGSVRDAFATLGRKPLLAQTFPTGTHAMWLNHWLASHDVDPLRDVRSVVIPPPEMVAALAGGGFDGFCAGEPWHAVAGPAARGGPSPSRARSGPIIRRRCSRPGAISSRCIRPRPAR